MRLLLWWLHDHERSAIRRWAAAILGGSGMQAIEPLCKTSFRRKRDRCRSPPLGDARASGTMCQALEDRSAYAVETVPQ